MIDDATLIFGVLTVLCLILSLELTLILNGRFLNAVETIGVLLHIPNEELKVLVGT